MSVNSALSVTLIVPAGAYEARIAKSILRSGASKVYLVSSKKPPYADRFEKTSSKLYKRFEKILDIRKFDSVDFADFGDICRGFTKALYVERVEDPNSQILFDITATTKEATMVASMMAQAERLQVTYVPRPSLSTEEEVDRRYDQGKEELELSYEPLEERIVLSFPEPKWRTMSKEEICMLTRIYRNKNYTSAKSLIDDIQKEKPGMMERKRYWIRTLHKLEDRNFVRLDNSGKTKHLILTEAGEGTVKGINEAVEYLKTKHYDIDKIEPLALI